MKLSHGIILISLLFLSACVGQTKKTHRLFQKEGVTQHRLAESMEALKVWTINGGSQEQLYSVRALRHIEKFNPDASRRKQALQTLVVAALKLEESKAQRMSLSRVELRLESKNRVENLTVLQVLKEVVTGQVGVLEADHSLFKEEVSYQFTPLKKEEREKAALFLEEAFLDLPLFNQVALSRVFGEILSSPSRCVEFKSEKRKSCIAHDYVDQQGFKGGLIKKIDFWLKNETLAPVVQVELMLAVEQAKGLADAKIVESTFYKWSEDKEMPKLVTLLAGAGYRKIMGDHEEIFTPSYRAESEKSAASSKIVWNESNGDTTTEMADKLKAAKGKQEEETRKIAATNFILSADYRDPSQNISRPYWFANAESILFYQLFKPEQNSAREVPEEWVFSPYYQKRSESIDQRTILYTYSRKALRSGFVLEGQKPLLPQLLKYIPDPNRVEDDLEIEQEEQVIQKLSPLELKERLQMASLSLPSLKARGERPEVFLNQIAKSFDQTKDPFEKELYLQMLHSLDEIFPEVSNKKFCKAFLSLGKGEQVLALQGWSKTPPETYCGAQIRWKEEGYQDPAFFIPPVILEADLPQVALNRANLSDDTEEAQEADTAPTDAEKADTKAGSETSAEAATTAEAPSKPWYMFWKFW